ncbi:MAG: replication-associated recombination protein A [Clostridia bacterium]|nr:replication-associated recombination protein A [Clostridia bacterium]
MIAPLADRMRPSTLDEVVGQKHILGTGRALRNIMESGRIPNLIFYGPSGVGKTTVARILAQQTDMRLHKLNGTTASTADIKAVVEELDTLAGANGILLYLDEIQYFNKRQQQTLLEFIENGRITLIASTTENPYFYVYNAILSRSTVFEFKPVEVADVSVAVERGFAFLEQEKDTPIAVDEGVCAYIAGACGGDVRKALNAVELCVLAGERHENGVHVTRETAAQLAQRSAMRYDRQGDEHYDILSAYQKSMRGSDAQAALHYLARLLEAGDLPSACRRLLVCANEDVGLAYPQIIPIVKAAVDTALQVGMPEARIPLANAVVLVCQAPKSNAVYNAINQAFADVQAGKAGPIPRTLQNKHYDGAEVEQKGQFYRYPHDFPGHWVSQQYLPDVLRDTVYYTPGDNKTEQSFAAYWKDIKK